MTHSCLLGVAAAHQVLEDDAPKVHAGRRHADDAMRFGCSRCSICAAGRGRRRGSGGANGFAGWLALADLCGAGRKSSSSSAMVHCSGRLVRFLRLGQRQQLFQAGTQGAVRVGRPCWGRNGHDAAIGFRCAAGVAGSRWRLSARQPGQAPFAFVCCSVQAPRPSGR